MGGVEGGGEEVEVGLDLGRVEVHGLEAAAGEVEGGEGGEVAAGGDGQGVARDGGAGVLDDHQGDGAVFHEVAEGAAEGDGVGISFGQGGLDPGGGIGFFGEAGA